MDLSLAHPLSGKVMGQRRDLPSSDFVMGGKMVRKMEQLME
jgi:hypothetical protein